MGLGKRSTGEARIADGGDSIQKNNLSFDFYQVLSSQSSAQVWWWGLAKGHQIQFQTEVGAWLHEEEELRIELEFRLHTFP